MLDMERYACLARKAVAEGCVLLKNDERALPILKGCKVASFGRSQFNYYKSGTGSGGGFSSGGGLGGGGGGGRGF